MDNFLLPRLQGGLGNQLFICAACYVIQHIHKDKNIQILFPNHPDNRQKKSSTDSDTIFLAFPNSQKITLPNEIIAHLHTFAQAAQQSNIAFVCPQEKPYSPWDPHTIQIPCFLEGYFQYYPPLEPFIQEICEIVRNALPTKSQPIREHSVFIHVRRGDFVELQEYHFLQSKEYYENALQHFDLTTHTFYIFSDDIEYCKKSGMFDTIQNKVFVEEEDELVTFAMMSKCTHGAICANSTFSWWGAMLATNYENMKNNTSYPIIVPSKWGVENPQILFPDTWTIL